MQCIGNPLVRFLLNHVPMLGAELLALSASVTSSERKKCQLPAYDGCTLQQPACRTSACQN